jgi:heme-degrading monooxygenase HmoA
MDPDVKTDAAIDAEPVIGVIKLKTSAAEAPSLLKEINAIFIVERTSIPGFLAAQVLQSLDGRTIVIMTEWTDRHAWARSRYDMRIGKLIEHFLLQSATIEFELYVRRGEVPKA